MTTENIICFLIGFVVARLSGSFIAAAVTYLHRRSQARLGRLPERRHIHILHRI